MISKATITFVYCSALSLALCAVPALRGQSPAASSQSAGDATKDSANELTVTVGKSLLVDTEKPVQRVAMGLGDFAEATAISRTEILVNGKAPGETSLIIWETGGGRQFFNVTVRPVAAVTPDNLEALRRQIRAEFPGQSVKLTADNGTVFVRGTVKNLASSDRAVQIAATGGGKVVNLLYVDVPPADPQILLKVRFASVDRSKSKQLGINLFSTGLGNTIGGITTGQYSPPYIQSTPGSVTTTASSTIVTPPTTTASFSNELNFLALFPGLNAGADIQALESKGVVEVLAEPNVIAANGKQASFLAGGEYPYPVVQSTAGGSGAVTIAFKEYGVRLNFIPTITPRGTIRLQVAPEVSSLDFSNAVQISGFNVPAISTRKVRTEVELKEGQTFVIGGLLDNRETETFQKIPFLGDIPVLGKFFQSMSRNKTNTELIVIVTPEIVSPIDAGAPVPELKYPEKFLPANTGIPMNNPDAKTAANTLQPAQPTIPVEKLIESMQPETPLVIDSANGRFGTGASTTTTMNTPAPVSSAPAATAPQ